MHIRAQRLERGLSQAKLAREAKVPLSRLRRWERGLEIPHAEELREVARALSIGEADLAQAQERYADEAIPGEGYTTARPEENGVVTPRRKLVPPGALRVLDLFCGSGGFSHGFEATGQFAVTAGIDLLPDRVSTFSANHPYSDAIVGDIRSFSPERLGDYARDPDVVIGGPPCQGFSSIRPFRTYTESDARNNLYEHFAHVVGTLRPRWFVLENVLGLLTNRKGKSFAELLESFGQAGYTTDWRVVNAAAFGLAQNRERLIVVGNRDGRQFEWPQPTHRTEHRSMAGPSAKRLDALPLLSGPLEEPVPVMSAIHDLPPVGAGESADEYRADVEPTPYEVRLRNGVSRLTLHEATAHSERMLQIIRKAGNNRSAVEDLTSSGFSSCYSRLEPNRPSVTLTVNFVHPSSNKCIHPYQDRALTPREGARLQGFPDAFVFEGTRSRIVKQIGNAVPPLLGQSIASALADQW